MFPSILGFIFQIFIFEMGDWEKAEIYFYKAVHKIGPGLQITHKKCPQRKSLQKSQQRYLQKSQQKSHQNLNKNYNKNPNENPIKNPNSTSFFEHFNIFFPKRFLYFRIYFSIFLCLDFLTHDVKIW